MTELEQFLNEKLSEVAAEQGVALDPIAGSLDESD